MARTSRSILSELPETAVMAPPNRGPPSMVSAEMFSARSGKAARSGRAARHRTRVATTRVPASTDQAPAQVSAAISPKLWPMWIRSSGALFATALCSATLAANIAIWERPGLLADSAARSLFVSVSTLARSSPVSANHVTRIRASAGSASGNFRASLARTPGVYPPCPGYTRATVAAVVCTLAAPLQLIGAPRVRPARTQRANRSRAPGAAAASQPSPTRSPVIRATPDGEPTPSRRAPAVTRTCRAAPDGVASHEQETWRGRGVIRTLKLQRHPR